MLTEKSGNNLIYALPIYFLPAECRRPDWVFVLAKPIKQNEYNNNSDGPPLLRKRKQHKKEKEERSSS